MKYDRTGYIGGYSTSTGAVTVTAEADVSVAVIAVPRQLTGQNENL